MSRVSALLRFLRTVIAGSVRVTPITKCVVLHLRAPHGPPNLQPGGQLARKLLPRRSGNIQGRRHPATLPTRRCSQKRLQWSRRMKSVRARARTGNETNGPLGGRFCEPLPSSSPLSHFFLRTRPSTGRDAWTADISTSIARRYENPWPAAWELYQEALSKERFENKRLQTGLVLDWRSSR